MSPSVASHKARFTPLLVDAENEVTMSQQGPISRRNFAMLLTAAAGVAAAPALIAGDDLAKAATPHGDAAAKPHDAQSVASTTPADDKLQSELLLDLVFD